MYTHVYIHTQITDIFLYLYISIYTPDEYVYVVLLLGLEYISCDVTETCKIAQHISLKTLLPVVCFVLGLFSLLFAVVVS